MPGVLYGRYAGDTYAGGNPWQLTTAALAQLFYRAAAYTLDHGLPDSGALELWEIALGLPAGGLPADVPGVADAFCRAGDSVLLRVREHVKADGGHLSEQIDKNSGKQTNAHDLTWSYAEVLTAMAKRDEYFRRLSVDM